MRLKRLALQRIVYACCRKPVFLICTGILYVSFLAKKPFRKP